MYLLSDVAERGETMIKIKWLRCCDRQGRNLTGPPRARWQASRARC